MEKVLEEQGKLQDRIDAAGAWELDSKLELAMDALRCRPPTPTSARCRAANGAAWRCAGCCCSRPTCCCSTSRPTISTPSRWRGSSISCRTIPARWWPSPTTAISSTTSPAGSSNSTGARASRGRATTRRGSSRSRSASRSRRSRKRGASGRCSASWSGSGCRRGPGRRRARPASTRTRPCWREESAQRIETAEIYIPPGPRLGDIVVEARGLPKGYGDVLLMDDVELHAAAGRHRRRHRARTAPARRRCSG